MADPEIMDDLNHEAEFDPSLVKELRERFIAKGYVEVKNQEDVAKDEALQNFADVMGRN